MLFAGVNAGLMLQPVAASAAPILTGDTVLATLNTFGAVTTPFASSAVVGAGVEFAGAVGGLDRGSPWNVTLDIGETGFSIGWTRGVGSFIASSPGLVGVTITNLDFAPLAKIIGVSRTGYSCNPSTHPSCGANDPVINFTDNSVSLAFRKMVHGETYTFDFATAETVVPAVPEPTSLALLGTGFATFVADRLRRLRAKTSAEAKASANALSR
jgi:hypothetical protein